MKALTIETPVDGITARRLLSLKGDPAFPMSPSLYSAILKAMGLGGCKRVYASQLAAWLKAHPKFKTEDSYPRTRPMAFEVGRPIYLNHGAQRFHFTILELKDGKPSRLELVET